LSKRTYAQTYELKKKRSHLIKKRKGSRERKKTKEEGEREKER